MNGNTSAKRALSPQQEKNVRGSTDQQTEDTDLRGNQQLDDPADPSVTPAEPRCGQCGQTFSSEAALQEHAKTCKGGHAPEVQPHFH